jgi:type III restriction enzyme
MSLTLKTYQQLALEALKDFFQLCAAQGAKAAFEQCVEQPVDPQYKIVYNDKLDGVPSVCLRVPTGGGKTLIAAHSVAIAAQHYAHTDSPVVLWIVPTDMIRQQTLSALVNVSHPYRQALQSYYGDKIRICDLDSLQTLNKHDVAKACLVIVTTIQAFNVSKTEQRNAYAFDEGLSAHFSGLSPQQTAGMELVTAETLSTQPFLTQADVGRVKHSLANWFHLHRPILIVDEAHKNRGGSSFFPTLKRLNPKCLVELTATPKDNNVLYSVSAAELKAAQMIKLPVVLTEHPDGWQACLRDALNQRQELELLAQKDKDYIRPILLVQAQPKGGEAVVDVVKTFLVDELKIDKSWVAISTGTTKELNDQNLFSPDCPIRVVITVEALKEGWDCSFAYVLASLQNINSATDVEQLLGRVLRMPYAQDRTVAQLNKAYAHVISDSVSEAAARLKDRMVENMGFNRWEADLAIAIPPQKLLDLQGGADHIALKSTPEQSIAIPYKFDRDSLPSDIQAKVKVYETSQGSTLVIEKGTDDQTFDQLQTKVLAQTPKKQLDKVTVSFEEARANRQAYLAPENWNATFAPIQQLCLNIDGSWQLADKEAIEDSVEWDILNFPVQLEHFNIRETAHSFEIDLNMQQKKLEYSLISSEQLAFDTMPTSITEIDLVNWLDRKVQRTGLTQRQLRSYLVKLVSYLINVRQFTLTALQRAQFQLATAVNDELDRLFELARHQAFQSDLFSQLAVDPTESRHNRFEFKAGIYPVRKPYRGSYRFEKHFYTAIDDLNEKTSAGKEAEEFLCAKALDLHPKVKHWVRNIPKQPNTSFWLPTDKDYFFPDFVAELVDGSIFILEYKGQYLYTADEARIKNAVGQQWAKGSSGKRIFLMARAKDEDGRDVETQINQALS